MMFRTVAREFFGTVVFVFTTTGAVIFSCNAVLSATGGLETANCRFFDARVVVLALTFAMANSVSAGFRRHFSQGHLHPATTIRLLVGRSTNLQKATFFILAQLAGAMVGIALVNAVNTLTYPRHPDGAPKVPLDGYPGGRWSIEHGLLFNLMTSTVQMRFNKDQNGNRSGESPSGAFLLSGIYILLYHLMCLVFRSCFITPLQPYPPLSSLDPPLIHWFSWLVPMTSYAITGMMVFGYNYKDIEDLNPGGPILLELDMEGAQEGHDIKQQRGRDALDI